jgi:hypothetical protein
MGVFDNRHAQTHTPEELLLQFFGRHFKKIGYPLDFGPA